MQQQFTEEQLREVAAQLRRPTGEHGVEVANMMNVGNERMNLDMIVALSVKNGERILEIGMGNGRFVPQIVGAAEDVTYAGCDYSQLMVEQAAELNAPLVAAGKASFHHGSCDNMPFSDSEFDKICTANTIYFWPDPVAVMLEFKRVLRPGGQLVLSLRPEHVMRTYPVASYNFDFWSKEKVMALMDDQGWIVQSVQENEEPPREVMGEVRPVANLAVVASLSL